MHLVQEPAAKHIAIFPDEDRKYAVRQDPCIRDLLVLLFPASDRALIQGYGHHGKQPLKNGNSPL
jgi:hypothetical protein